MTTKRKPSKGLELFKSDTFISVIIWKVGEPFNFVEASIPPETAEWLRGFEDKANNLGHKYCMVVPTLTVGDASNKDNIQMTADSISVLLEQLGERCSKRKVPAIAFAATKETWKKIHAHGAEIAKKKEEISQRLH